MAWVWKARELVENFPSDPLWPRWKFGCEAGHGLVSGGARWRGAACGGWDGEDGHGRPQPFWIARAAVGKEPGYKMLVELQE